MKTIAVHTIYIIWQKALRYPSHDQLTYVDVYYDGDLILSVSQIFDYDS
jgi:hypothetical protein